MELRGTDLGCVRGGRRVFEGVGFTVAAGTALLLTGANGAGESSLLRLIAGLIHPDHGTVALHGGENSTGVIRANRLSPGVEFRPPKSSRLRVYDNRTLKPATN